MRGWEERGVNGFRERVLCGCGIKLRRKIVLRGCFSGWWRVVERVVWRVIETVDERVVGRVVCIYSLTRIGVDFV